MATSFTTWTALRTAVLDAIADYVAGAPLTGEYTIMGRTMKYRSIEELQRLYEFADKMMQSENITASSRVSHGRFRRAG
uniref:Uncharacterized protein n=1 Tax=viral metagenome TaxID=1070528 RepID=A0A6M3K1Y3_9ZZZZ